MKIKILDDRQSSILKLKISGIDPSIANALRRIMIADTKCWAIDTVDFYKNESIMTFEEIAHRLGLLPLKKIGNLEPIVRLNYEAKTTVTILAKDLEYENIEPLYPDIPILILQKGQTVKFEAKITYNSKNGGGHAKWSPATAVFYNYEKDEFTFTIETTGSVTPKDLFTESLKILDERLESVRC